MECLFEVDGVLSQIGSRPLQTVLLALPAAGGVPHAR